ncbi:MAG: tyrosine-type recombinase/integrase [Lachnobacterium sp.]|nr:tyrosine-type recombinase/integrase [Lachnobacterium sp.]
MHTINEYLHKCQDALDIPRFRLHVLRHFAAAYLLKNGFNSTQIEDYMGWEHGSSVMQKVYAYYLNPHESQQDIASVF